VTARPDGAGNGTYRAATVWACMFWINGGVHLLFLIVVLIVLSRS
jgi:hypothetical protein